MADFDAGSIEATLALDRTAFTQGLRDAKKDGEDFEKKTFKAKADVDKTAATTAIDALDVALDALGAREVKATVKVNSGAANTSLTAIENRLDRIDGRIVTARVDAGTTVAATEVSALAAQLTALGAARTTVGIDFDLGQGAAEMTAISAALTALDGRRLDIGVDVDSTVAFLELDTLRQLANGLHGRRISIAVDVDAAIAIGRLTNIDNLTTALASRSPSIRVDVDAAHAQAQLAGVDAAVAALAGRDPSINVDLDAGAAIAQLVALRTAAAGAGTSAAGAAGGVSALAVAIGVLAATAVSILPALGAIAPAIGGMIAIVGAGAAAFQGIGGALKAYKKTQEDTGQSSAQLAQTELSNAIAIRNAQQGIDDARKSAASAAESAAKRVQEAQRQVTDVTRAAAQAADQSARAVAAAQRQVVDAVRSASQAAEQSARAVESAERQYTSAVQAERDAQVAVAQAREDAAAQLQSLERQVKNAGLAQEGAALRVAEAEAERAAVFAAGSQASELERRRADLAYRQAVQALEDQTARTAELKAEQADANTRQVDGAAGVVAAMRRQADAAQAVRDADDRVAEARERAAEQQEASQRRIEDAQTRLAQARQEAAQQQEASARRIEDAERNLVEARQAAADAGQRGQEQIARAVQSLADTQARQAAAAAAQLGDQKSAAQEYAEAMAALTPAGRAFVEQLISMKPLWGDIKKEAQEGLLPGLTDILKATEDMGPAITDVVGGFAKVLGNFGSSFAELMGTQRFQEQFAGIMEMSAGFTDQVLQSLIPLTDAFGAFALASGPTVKALADGFSGILGTGLPNFFEALAPGIAGAAQVLDGLFDLVIGLLPVIGQLATILANSLGPVFQALAPAVVQVAQVFVTALEPVMAALGPLLTSVVGAFGQLATAAGPVLSLIGTLLGEFLQALMPLVPPLTELAMVFVRSLAPVISALAQPLMMLVGAFVQLAGALVSALVPVITALVQAATPLIEIFAKVGAELVTMLVDAIVPILPQLSQLAVMLLQALGPVILKAVEALVPVVLAVAGAMVQLLPAIVPIVETLVTAGLPVFVALSEILVALSPTLVELVPPLADLLLSLLPIVEVGAQLLAFLIQVVTALGGWVIINAVIPMLNDIGGAVGWLAGVIAALATGVSVALNAIVTVFQWLYDVLVGHSIVPDLIHELTAWFTNGIEWVKDIWSKGWTWVRDKFVEIKDKVLEYVRGFRDDIKTAIQETVDGIKTVWNEIEKIFGTPVKFVIDVIWNKGLLVAWNFVNDLWGGKDLTPTPVDHIPSYATGGPITGPGSGTSDSILARVSNGEFVQPAATVAHYGPGVMEALRTRQIPRDALAGYAGGGAVSTGSVRGGLPAFWGGGLVDVIKDPIKAVGGVWNKAWEWGKERIHDGIKFVRGKMADGWDATAGKWIGKAADWAAERYGNAPALAEIVKGLPRHISDGIASFIRGADEQDKKENSGAAKSSAALAWAMTQAGKPYLWGGTGPDAWDCSGLVQAAYRAVGIALPRVTYDQTKMGRSVPLKDAQPGDLVMEHFSGPSPSHVGLYVRPGVLWDAPRSGDFVGESPIMNVTDVRRVSEQHGGGGAMTGDLAAWISDALVATGRPGTWLDPLMKIAQHESGGNPRAENHYDMNERLYGGTFGLMQTIRPTYNAHHQAGTSWDIFDPVSNAAAAINYIASRYGNPWNTPGIRSLAGGGPYRGYAAGGWAPAGQVAMVGEQGPELVMFGELARVLSAGDSRSLVESVTAALGALAAVTYAANRVSMPQPAAAAATAGAAPSVRVEMPQTVIVRIGERDFVGYMEDTAVAVVHDVIDDAANVR